MMDEDVLRASVQDLVTTFREALIGFIPIAERLVMPWRDENQHRDWERVAEAMFNACVRGPIEAEAERSIAELPLARYDIDVDSYAQASWISVHGTSHDHKLAMVRLQTDRDPFDLVHAAVIDPETFQVVGTVQLPIRDARFSFNRRIQGVPDEEVAMIVALE